MKAREYKWVMAVLVAAVFTARAQTDIPFSAGFESFEVGDIITGQATSPWWAPNIAAVVTNSPAAKDGSANVLFSPDNLRLRLMTDGADDFHTNVWWSAYARVLPQEDSAVPSMANTAAAFFLTETGDLKAYSNDTWVVIQQGVPTGGWIKFSVHLDFGSETYDIYRSANTFAHGDSLIRQNPYPLAFNSAYTHSNELTRVDVDGETYLDTITLASGNPQPIVAGTPSHEKALVTSEPSQLVREGTTLSGAALRFFAASDTLDGPFGAALQSWLLDGDKVSIYVGGEGWRTFLWNGTDWIPELGTYTVADAPITPTSGIRIHLLAEGTREAIYTASFPEEYSHTQGTVPIAQGWNLFSLPFTAGARTPGTLGIVNPGQNDILAVNDTGNRFVVTRFSSGQWRPAGNLNIHMPAGSGFWYYKAAGSNAEWNLNY